MLLSPSQFSTLFPKSLCPYSSFGILSAFGINTKNRENCFLAQCALESNGFQWLEVFITPKSKYTLKTWTDQYEFKKNLGNTQPGDGMKYRERGIIHLTGRANYEKYGKLLKVDLINNPDLAKDPTLAIKIACTYWNSVNCNVDADIRDMMAITKKINGGYNGWRERELWLKKIEEVQNKGP